MSKVLFYVGSQPMADTQVVLDNACFFFSVTRIDKFGELRV